MKRGGAFTLVLALVLLSLTWAEALGMAVYTDGAQNAGNAFQAWATATWVQTTQGDSDAGVLNSVDTTASPGDVKLNTATTTLGTSPNNPGNKMNANDVYIQLDSDAQVPYNGEIISWTYYDAGNTSNGARLEFLAGSGTTWRMMAKSDAVTITGTNTFTVSIPVEAGWYLGVYTGSSQLKHYVGSGTVLRRGNDSGDFDASVTKTDFSDLSPRHLALTAVLRYYLSSGTIASQVLDTGKSGARWYELQWDETLAASTDITFEVRASDTPFLKDAAAPSWTSVTSVGGTSPVSTGLPSGRYMQWRATLTTSDSSETPTLHEVRVYYY